MIQRIHQYLPGPAISANRSVRLNKSQPRHGLTFTEVVVAATLVVSMIGFVAPLTVRVGRVWQSTRQYRLAFNELTNQMELLTSLGVSRCEAALANLKPSASATESLPEARLEGQLIRDQDGTRLILSIDWDRGAKSVPVSLVGWLDTDSFEQVTPLVREGEATPVNMFKSTSANQFIDREGEAPAEPLRHKLGRSLALPLVPSAVCLALQIEKIGEQP